MSNIDNLALEDALEEISEWLFTDDAEVPRDRVAQSALQEHLQKAVTGLTLHLSRVNLSLASRNTAGGVRMGE